MTKMETQLTRLLNAYPDSYETEAMRSLWLSKWSDHPTSVIFRSVDRAIRAFHNCPGLDEFMEIVADESVRQNRAVLRERMENCSDCDQGFIESKENHFHPCENCLPDAHHRWVAGDYEPTRL